MYLMIRLSWGCSEDEGATNHGLLSTPLLGAGSHVAACLFRGFAGGRKACRFFGVASELSVDYCAAEVLVKFKELHCLDFLAKSFKELGRIEVKPLTS
jgi:hypothetical protein